MTTRTSPLLLALLLAMLASGCGQSSSSASSEAQAGAGPLKLLHAFDEFGDDVRGRYTSVLPVEDKLLVGTEDGLEVFGFSQESGFTAEKQHKLRSSPATQAVVRHIRSGQNGESWVASTEGVARFRGLKFELQETSGPAKDAALFRKSIWIARSNGLEIYEPVLQKMNEMPILLRDGSETSDNIGTKQPLALASLDKDTLLVGCQFGFLKAKQGTSGITWSHHYGKWYLPQGDYVAVQEGNTAIPGNRIYNLKKSPDGTQMAVCTDGGLAVFDTASFDNWKIYQGKHRVPKADPGKGLSHEEIDGNIQMPSSDVMDVAFGKTMLYLATKKGLVVVSREDPRKIPAKVYGLNEGLPSSHVNSVALSADGKVLFVATQYGLAAYQVQGS